MRLFPLFFVGTLLACSSPSEKKDVPADVALSPTLRYAPNEPANVLASNVANVPAPEGMVLVPSGKTLIGSEEGLAQEQPTFWITTEPFWMDQHPVTVAEFRQFIQATNYKTQAETFGDGGVFSEGSKEWTLVKGACWHHPLGTSAPAASDDHPVTQVSWNDATAYAKWAGKRLPTELEWEHAARNGRNDRTRYPFGNELIANGKALANTWNGTFPEHNENTDGFRTTSPVGQFGKTPLGLADMTGNVWQWCENWRFNYGDVPNGLPTTGQEKAMRGGSFLCEPGWCHGYRVSGRSFSTPETSLLHVGFRCVKSLK